MIYKLDPSKYEKVRALFDVLEQYQPMCSAVLEGVCTGEVFVDDLKHPRTAILSTFLSSKDDGMWGFLAGEPSNDAFNRAVNEAIHKREIISAKAPVVFLTCQPQDWNGQLPVVFYLQEPIPMLRRHYECHEFTFDWRSDVPEGCAVRPLNGTILTEPELKIPDEIYKIMKKWRSISDPRFKDFGFVCIHGDRIVSWATIDFISGGVGEAGIFTLEGHRRRGLAAIVTAAAVEYGLSNDLSKVNWTCTEGNIASIRTAEKLGFDRKPDYMMYYMIFDEVEHLGNLAYSYLQNEQYREAVDVFEKNLALRNDLPLWAYFDVARGWAGLGNQEKMFSYLNTLVDRGWTEVEALERCKEFNPWRETPEWKLLIKCMRGNV